MQETTTISSEFAVPIGERYFEDYVSGRVYEFGTASITEAEIIEYARKYDPQYIHIDPEAALSGPLGGLIASGWQTAGLMMRLFVDNFLSSVASIASPGIDELRWTRPVRPGNKLRIRITITETTRSRSKPDRGMVRTSIEVINQADEVVMTLKAMNLLRCRRQD
ncbi:MAG TPA: MaoC family dehydratase [Blastocatellia bacterium]